MTQNVSSEGFLHRFLKIANKHPETTAIEDIDKEVLVTYGELKEIAEKRKGAYTFVNVKPGDRVALILPNGVEFIANYLALVSHKALPVLINDKLTSSEISQFLKISKPDFIITTTKFVNIHKDSITGDNKSYKILVSEEIQMSTKDESNFNLAQENYNAEALTAPSGNPPISLQFTWRGTGRPFLVSHRYLDMTQSSDGLHEFFYPQGIGSVHLVALPFYAIFGLTVLLIFPLSVGATLLITNTILNRDLVEVLARHRVTFSCLVPDVIRYFCARLSKRTSPPTGLHPQLMIYSGGSHLPIDDAEKLSKLLGCGPVLQGYGLTETLPIIVQNTLGEQHRGALGQPIRGTEISIVGSDGVEVKPGYIGELKVRGPMLSDGYYQDEEGSSLFFSNDWFYTGDLVWRDENNHLFFVCQRLRISKIRAQMIDLSEIEQTAMQHPVVQDARAWVMRDNNEANVLYLSVKVLDISISQQELLSFMGKYLSGFKLPKKINLVSI
ncbi:acyl--CoA ligase [Klebsiella michiganensis]|nr:acyl--CoA ligase [Klebsiella michiganensis]HBU6430621.1 acyl--CoA ligase [Klebsiella oxytoca]